MFNFVWIRCFDLLFFLIVFFIQLVTALILSIGVFSVLSAADFHCPTFFLLIWLDERDWKIYQTHKFFVLDTFCAIPRKKELTIARGLARFQTFKKKGNFDEHIKRLAIDLWQNAVARTMCINWLKNVYNGIDIDQSWRKVKKVKAKIKKSSQYSLLHASYRDWTQCSTIKSIEGTKTTKKNNTKIT